MDREGRDDALAIDARDVFKIYKQGRAEVVPLRGASLQVHRGEFVSIVGPSGSGKSTLLSILAGLTTPSAGSVIVEEQDLADLDDEGLARWRNNRVGVVFQQGNLVSFLSAEENIALVARRRLGRRRARGRARELLHQLGLADRSRHRPAQLSGGEAQRVAIGVALANDPAVVFGDEITGELDSATAEAVMAMLLDVQRERGLTMLLVTHSSMVAALAERKFEFRDGLVTDP